MAYLQSVIIPASRSSVFTVATHQRESTTKLGVRLREWLVLTVLTHRKFDEQHLFEGIPEARSYLEIVFLEVLFWLPHNFSPYN